MESKSRDLKLSFVPGTGNMGSVLAGMHASAGYEVYIGSRNIEKAEKIAEEIRKQCDGKCKVSGLSNKEAAAKGDVIFWTVQAPLDERHAILKELKSEFEGKIIVDVTNVMYLYDEKEWGQVSSVLQNQAALGVPAKWTCAWKGTFFQSLTQPKLKDGSARQVFVCGDDEAAVQTVMSLVDSTGFEGVHFGGLKESKICELLGPPHIMNMVKYNGGSFGCWKWVKE